MSSKNSRFSPFQKQCFVTAAVGINIIGHGCVLGFPAILLPQLHEPSSPIQLTKEQESWIASITGIVMMAGAFIMLHLMSCSRKTEHYAVIAPVAIGWAITIAATSFQAIFIGRMLCGLSFGMLYPLRSVLIGEYTSPKNRGAFLTTVSLAQAFGIFFVHLLGSLLSWKTTAIICMFFSIISFAMTIYCPESPSWLASKGRYDDCRKVFKWMRGDDEDEELEAMIHARILMEKKTIGESVRQNRLKSIRDTIKKREFYLPIIVMIHANAMLQFSGGTTMAAYCTKILTHLMGPGANIHLWMVVLDIQRIVSNSAAVYVINRAKRRTMMFATGGISVCSHLAIAVYVYSRNQNWISGESVVLPAILINLLYFAVSTGTVPLPNVIAGEVFPLEYKGIGGMIGMVSLSGCMFLVLKTFPGLVDSVGLNGTYLIFAAVLFYNLVVVWFTLPETKGRTLQEIEDEFRGKPLAPEEIEVRKSMQADPVMIFKRKESEWTGSAGFLNE
ncbi:facilitated trehalose transporter Tret1-like [Ostrinia nubilalis]|uniref:facilitated trehalose transporter Tret1-like n=1 Tax=Ostrinia nubilalis TaxID=29057 RepID=UPI0030823008